MFETIIASLLKGYVARYVDINADQLSVQLLYGRPIVVENLTFNKTALNHDIRTKLKLPIEIESLHVGKIQCSFVWSSLFFRSSSAAFIIKVENVRLRIKPVILDDQHDEPQEEKSEIDEITKKQNRLELSEQQLEKEFEYLGEVKASSWGIKRLILSFLEKIQVEIDDVDISYQSFTSDNQSYQVGLSFDHIQISNEFSDETMNRKIFQIQNLALYADHDDFSTHQYILLPSNSIRIVITHNFIRSPLINRQQPRYDLEWRFEDLRLKTSVNQIQILSDVIRFIQYSNIHRRFIMDSGRPDVKISRQSAKRWWHYITLVLLRIKNYIRVPTANDQTHSTINFWFNSTILKKRSKQLATYKRLYRSYLDHKYSRRSTTIVNFSIEDRQLMREIEMDFDLDILLKIRRIIFQIRANEQFSLVRNQQQSNNDDPNRSWYMSYARWVSSKTVDLLRANPTETNLSIHSSMSATSNVTLNENDEILQEQVNQFIAQSLEDEDLSRNRRDSLYLRLNIALASVQIDLMSNTESIFKFSLNNVSVLTELRPRHESFVLSIGLQDLNISDQTRTDAFSKIVYPKQRTDESKMSLEKTPVLELCYEKNPPINRTQKKRISFSITIRSRGLCFVCCPLSFERLRSFFTSAFTVEPSSSPSLNSSTSILQHWTQLKDRTTKRFKATLEQIFSKNVTKLSSSNMKHIKQGKQRHRKKFNIFLDICAPQMIVPESSDRALIIDFGYLMFRNDEDRNSSCPLINCDIHKNRSTYSPQMTDSFQSRTHFLNDRQQSPTTSAAIEDENEEFLTPDSSPMATDLSLENETNSYPVNLVPQEQTLILTRSEEDFLYSTFSLSLCDMQLGYLPYSNNQSTNKSSSIIENFGVCFLIQYRTVQTFDSLWPLIKVSGTLPRLIIHLDPSRLETLFGTLLNWKSFLENLTPSIVSKSDSTSTNSTIDSSDQSSARFTLGFRVNEVSLQLSDDDQALCEIRIENTDFTLMNWLHSNIISFTVHTLMIVDAIQKHGKDYQLLLTSHRAFQINTETGTLYESQQASTIVDNEYLIRVDIHSFNQLSGENSLKTNIQVNKLHLVFNPETLSILINFSVNILHRVQEVRQQFVKDSREIQQISDRKALAQLQINSEFQELSILFTNVLTLKGNGKRSNGMKLEKVAAVRIRAASLITTLEPSTHIDATICSLQIFNLLQDSTTMSANEKSCAIIDLGTDENKNQEVNAYQDQALPSKAFHLVYSKQKADFNQEKLQLEMASVCYTHSPKIIFKIEQILKYVVQHCHSRIALQMEKVKQNVLKQGTMLFNQFVLPNESMLPNDSSPRHLNLCVVLATPILVFRPQSKSFSSNDRLVVHLGNIHVANSEDHRSIYQIEISDVHLFSIDIEHELRRDLNQDLVQMYKNPHAKSPILDNISINLNLCSTDVSTTIDSKLLSSVQMFLGKHQITLFQNIISSLTYNENDESKEESVYESTDNDNIILLDQSNETIDDALSIPTVQKPFKTFAMHFELPELILTFQGDLEMKAKKVCEATFGQFHMSIEQDHQFCKIVQLRLNSLQIKDCLVNIDEYLFSTRCRRNSFPEVPIIGDEFSTSEPNESHPFRSDHSHSPSSLPAYAGSINSSTWTLTQLSPSRYRPVPTNTPAFINIRIVLIDRKHEDFSDVNINANAQFGEVNIRFIISTWVMLLDIIGLIGGRPSPKPKGIAEIKEIANRSDTDFMQISIQIDAVSCLLQEDQHPSIRISLQRFNCGIRTLLIVEKALKTLTVDGNLGSVSVKDLSQFKQLYEERFCTTGTNALHFTFTKEENLIPIEPSNFPARLKLFLRMASVQYIHTQRFLMQVINFFDRFNSEQDCYNRIRLAEAGEVISWNAGRSTGVELDVEAQTPILILPAHVFHKSVIILHLGNIIVKNQFLTDNQPGTLNALANSITSSTCLLDVISVQFQQTILYSASYCLLDPRKEIDVKFSNFGFQKADDHYSMMLREATYLNIQIERNLDNALNHASPTFSVKADVSSVDILLDTKQYALIRAILAYNIGEQLEQSTRPGMMVEDPLCVSTVLTGDVYVDIRFVIEMKDVGFEIFIPKNQQRYSLGCCAFSKSKFLFEKNSNNHKTLNLNCSSIKLTDTRIDTQNLFRDILTSSSSMRCSESQMQFEIQLSMTKNQENYVIVLNHTRVLFIIDWLLKFVDFLNSFEQTPIPSTPSLAPVPALPKKLFELRLNFNQCELFLVQMTDNKQSNALVLNGAVALVYRESIVRSPLQCESLSFSLFSCQMNDVQSTGVPIIEPSRLTFNIQQAGEEQLRNFELNLPQLFIRLSYSDIKVMMQMFQSILKQIDHAQSRDVIRKNSILPPKQRRISQDEFILEYCPDDRELINFRVRPAAASNLTRLQSHESLEENKEKQQPITFLNLHTIKFSCDHARLCLIDDCLDANIPLLNLNLTEIKLIFIDYESHCLKKFDLKLNIDYYNRLLSGYEPFIELWSLCVTLKSFSKSKLLRICSNHVLNVNYTKAMHQLFDQVKNNWLKDFNSTQASIHEPMYFRRPKPFEPYCFKNLIGQRVKFRTALRPEGFDQYEHIVEHNEMKSFTFPNDSSTSRASRQKETGSKQSHWNRRLLITIDGWENIQPISIDSVGTFFRLAFPSGVANSIPVLVFIDIIMIDSAMRSITIRSAVEVLNRLLTPIDLRIKYGLSSLHDLRLEPNESRSLPLKYCPNLSQIQLRPSDFGLDYCAEPIKWSDIVDGGRRRRDYQFDHEGTMMSDNEIPDRNIDFYTADRQSFFRTCKMNSDESLYFFCIQSKRNHLHKYKNQNLSTFELSIMSPLVVNNLLPCDLFFQIYPHPQKIRLNAYKSYREHALDIGQAIDIVFATELYHMEKPLRVPSINDLNLMKYFRQRVPLFDSVERLLMVDVTIICSIRNRLKITVSIPYVLLNKSGIPLIFKQEETQKEAAGQTHEHEIARSREPLLFSFSDQESSHACIMRVGQGLHKNDDGIPLWSLRFSLERGSSFRELHVRSPHGSPDWIYYIGIDVRQGKGRLRRTNFIFLSTRYMISNQCSYDLSIAQRHIVRAMQQTGDHTNVAQRCLHVLKHSNVPYHWPRSDLDQLLCVRVINNPQYKHVYWSGGFQIGRVNAFHINLRYNNNQCLILRVQVIERGGTFFVVFMDSNQMPAPLRIKNLSDVPIQFYQSETREELTYLRAFIQPHESIDYAWDEITLKQTITCSVLGGTEETYDLQKLGSGENLFYENHICLGLEKTFEESPSKHPFEKTRSSHDRVSFSISQRHQLVVDYVQGKLVLARREEDKRSQLWRMTSNGVLVHTGSSSPRDWSNKNDKSDDIRHASVLDIQENTLHSTYTSAFGQRPSRLTIRRFDPKRSLTQTWTFQEDGYLCMSKTQMCIQVFGDLKEGTELVLGPRPMDKIGNRLPPPPTMFIRPHRRLKGSGLLSVRTYADGPTRVLEVTDVKASNSNNNLQQESASELSVQDTDLTTLFNLELRLEAGIGISIISSMGHESEELVYMILNDIRLNYQDEKEFRSVDLKIGAIIASNQLLTTSNPCLLYATPSEEPPLRSAISLEASLQKSSDRYENLYIFQCLNIHVNGIIIQLDEILLWKLIEFAGIHSTSPPRTPVSATAKTIDQDDQTYDLDEGEYDTQRLLSLLTSTRTTRIYFNELSLSSIDLNLSVYCGNSRSLPPHLLMIKRHSPFPLIRFENAPIHLSAYEHIHIFNTYDFFLLALSNHYVRELKRQALKILGSVDFLGNPLGLFNDLTDGFASLVDHGSVTGLVKNVAHGVADSTSKFTGTISYGIGKLALDEDHDDMREAIADNYRGSTLSHVFGGTVGLAVGVIGGLTSIITQPYKGVVEEGMGGLVKGFAKGIVGTVSKPVVGMLDFANGLAMAVKEGSRSSDSILRSRIRAIRCATNMFGLLQPYSQEDAEGQQLLYRINKYDYLERYITRVLLSQNSSNSVSKRRLDQMNDHECELERRIGRIYAMITSQRVIIYRTEIKCESFDYEPVIEYSFQTINGVSVKEDEYRRTYIEFVLQSSLRRPTSPSLKNQNYDQYLIFRCDLHERAARLVHDIQRAKDIFEEEKFTYMPIENTSNGDENEDDIPDESGIDEKK